MIPSEPISESRRAQGAKAPLKVTHVTFSGDQTVAAELEVRPGLGLMAIKNLPIEFDCRRADCGICIVRVIEGADQLSPPTKPEQDFLTAMAADENERLACQCRVFGAVALEVELP